jgi:TonB family protein
LPEEKKYRNYSAADIEKYHKGLLSSREMNDLEKAALDDPFLADALEGYRTTTVNNSSDLAELQRRLEDRVSDKKVIAMISQNTFKWWKLAAAALFIGGTVYFTYQLSTGRKNKEVASKGSKNGNPVLPGDSDLSKTADSTSVAFLNKEDESTRSNLRKKRSIASSSGSDTTRKDVAIETNTVAAATFNNTQSKDSVSKDETAAGYSAPVAVEKKSAAAVSKQPNGLVSSKESGSDDQEKTNYFRGRVADANNNPLPFANITNTKDNVGTYTDVKGNFTLISRDSILDVQVRSVGFENNTVRLKNNAVSNNVVLQDDKTTSAKVLSFQKPDTDYSRGNNVQFGELEPADGWNNYNTYLANNINVPEDLKRKPAETGKVELSFDVNQEGEPVNIKVERSLCQKCDEEAIRLIKQGPKWKKKNKKAKRITITVPFDGE